jgi:hypothetical protein
MYINGIHNTTLGQNSIRVPVQQGGKSSWNRPSDPNIKVDFEGFQTYKLCPYSSNHRYIYIYVIEKKLGLNSIHVLVQQGGKSSWNRPIDPNIKVALKCSKHRKYVHPLLIIDTYILM